MKRYLLISMIMLASIVFASSAFAATELVGGTTTVIGGADFVPSTGVEMNLASEETTYAAQSKHLSGSKEYGTTADSSELSVKDADVGTACTSPSSTSALTGF